MKVDWTAYQEEGMNDLLRQYRAVRDVPEQEEPCPPGEAILIGLRELYRTRWHIFNDRHTSLEKAYEEMKTATARVKEAEVQLKAPRTLLTKWDGQGPCPTCKREPVDKSTQESVERGLAWLKEHGDG